MVSGALSPLSPEAAPLRPLVPRRASYWLWFVLAAIGSGGMFGYLLWARSRGILDRSHLWTTASEAATWGLLLGLIGMFYRWRWLKARYALARYERMMAALDPPSDG